MSPAWIARAAPVAPPHADDLSGSVLVAESADDNFGIIGEPLLVQGMRDTREREARVADLLCNSCGCRGHI